MAERESSKSCCSCRVTGVNQYLGVFSSPRSPHFLRDSFSATLGFIVSKLSTASPCGNIDCIGSHRRRPVCARPPRNGSRGRPGVLGIVCGAASKVFTLPPGTARGIHSVWPSAAALSTSTKPSQRTPSLRVPCALWNRQKAKAQAKLNVSGTANCDRRREEGEAKTCEALDCSYCGWPS
jgi:hypothetical protein